MSLSGNADMGDGNVITIGEDGLGTHTYAVAGDYTVVFTPADGNAPVSTTVSATDAPPPPTEQIEWRYMVDITNVEPDYYVDVSENGYTTKFQWADANIATGVVTSASPVGYRYTHADGTVWEIGQFKEDWHALVNQPSLVTSKMYEIGRVYMA